MHDEELIKAFEEERAAVRPTEQELDTEATISFLQSIIEDQAFQIEALQIRIKDLTTLKNL